MKLKFIFRDNNKEITHRGEQGARVGKSSY
jgi:hypothetical protein